MVSFLRLFDVISLPRAERNRLDAIEGRKTAVFFTGTVGQDSIVLIPCSNRKAILMMVDRFQTQNAQILE
jgi:hypothetical protein